MCDRRSYQTTENEEMINTVTKVKYFRSNKLQGKTTFKNRLQTTLTRKQAGEYVAHGETKQNRDEMRSFRGILNIRATGHLGKFPTPNRILFQPPSPLDLPHDKPTTRKKEFLRGISFPKQKGYQYARSTLQYVVERCRRRD